MLDCIFSRAFLRLFFKLSKKVFQKFGSFAILAVIVVKGKQRSHHPKGGENLKSNNHEQDKRHAFDSFCKKVLKHEARDYYDELKRQRNKEVSFSDCLQRKWISYIQRINTLLLNSFLMF